MIARNRIWEELKQAKTYIICLQRYTDRGRRWSRLINGAIIAISAIGALGSIYHTIFAIVGVSLVALTSILKTALSGIMQSEQEFSELDRLIDFYSKYMNKIERLWYDFFIEAIEEKEMIHDLLALKEEECDRYSLLNKLIRSISKKEQKEIDKISVEYINIVYFNKFEDNGKDKV